ncbi:ParB/RepB/Spo0J family partition protein [Acidithiobacillus ferriphilus]|uniref:ParB/RepB/Spo0J family partition protein n=1 Tax=Acidithiobacillus ferriphilus TaxID=1689834 RepID=UPI003F514A2C
MKESLLKGLNLDAARVALQVAPEDVGKPTLVALYLPLDAIQPDPNQPRRSMEGATPESQGLEDLAASILQHGVLQPITVEALEKGKYRIIAGERRWRAARMALDSGQPCARKGYDLSRIPSVIAKSESANDRLEMQLVENLARADMRDEDVAVALQTLLDTLQVSKAELARRLGRSRSWINLVLAKGGGEAPSVADQIGVPLEGIGMHEMQRMLVWKADPDREPLLDRVAESIRCGRDFNRSLLDEIEQRHSIESRYPALRGRDLSLEDLQFVSENLDSTDPARQARDQRLLNGEPEPAPVDSKKPSGEESPAATPEGSVLEGSVLFTSAGQAQEHSVTVGPSRMGMSAVDPDKPEEGRTMDDSDFGVGSDNGENDDGSLEQMGCVSVLGDQPAESGQTEEPATAPAARGSLITVSLPLGLVEQLFDLADVPCDLSALDGKAVVSALERLVS